LLLSFTLWHGNRHLILGLRQRMDWFTQPLRKLVALIATTLTYSVAVTVLAMVIWFSLGPFAGINWTCIALVTAVVALAVLFVTHVYETTFLINERLEDRLRLEQLERARLQAELDTIKSQLAPHFLFNCLHALGVLIEESPAQARRFNQHMAAVCRYLLVQQKRDLVPLADELEFFEAYAALTRLRFIEGLQIKLAGFEDVTGRYIPPASLQLLLENAIKHNAFSAREPLQIDISLDGDHIHFVNDCRHAGVPVRQPGAGLGLKNLRERFLLVTRRAIEVRHSGRTFAVSLPLMTDEQLPAIAVWK
jgi:LytS/YehU family sensor histidine kinase